ncbi:MAG: hypothetical protein IPL65_21920 [Lewinellaceae bacterium]|nr:hypothetical protein [Lewinellaceae bacterium]
MNCSRTGAPDVLNSAPVTEGAPALPLILMSPSGFQPDTGIEIYVSNAVVLVKGRALEDIFAYFLQNRLMWVREDSSGRDTGDEGVFVESLEVKGMNEMEII